jgi:hypothetical protein
LTEKAADEALDATTSQSDFDDSEKGKLKPFEFPCEVEE